MKLTFIRANHEVTGSCTMLEVGGHLGLVDCGMEQGRDVFDNIPIPAAANALEFVLVTHAHLDHTGLLPLLYKEGFRGTVYATQATCDLCDIMLKDSAHIQLSEAEWKSRKARRAGQPDVEPIYDLEDVEGLLKLLRPCPYGEQIQVEENMDEETDGWIEVSTENGKGYVKAAEVSVQDSYPVAETVEEQQERIENATVKDIADDAQMKADKASEVAQAACPRSRRSSSARSTAAAT